MSSQVPIVFTQCRFCLRLCTPEDLYSRPKRINKAEDSLRQFMQQILQIQIKRDLSMSCADCCSMWKMIREFCNSCKMANVILRSQEPVIRPAWTEQEQQKDALMRLGDAIRSHYVEMQALAISLKRRTKQVPQAPPQVPPPPPITNDDEDEEEILPDVRPEQVFLKQEVPLDIDDSAAFTATSAEAVDTKPFTQSQPSCEVEPAVKSEIANDPEVDNLTSETPEDQTNFSLENAEEAGEMLEVTEGTPESPAGAGETIETIPVEPETDNVLDRSPLAIDIDQPTETEDLEDDQQDDLVTVLEPEVDLVDLIDSSSDDENGTIEWRDEWVDKSGSLNKTTLQTICQICGAQPPNMATHLESHIVRRAKRKQQFGPIYPVVESEPAATQEPQEHDDSQNNSPGGIRCEVCGLQFATPLAAKIHTRLHPVAVPERRKIVRKRARTSQPPRPQPLEPPRPQPSKPSIPQPSKPTGPQLSKRLSSYYPPF